MANTLAEEIDGLGEELKHKVHQRVQAERLQVALDGVTIAIDHLAEISAEVAISSSYDLKEPDFDKFGTECARRYRETFARCRARIEW